MHRKIALDLDEIVWPKLGAETVGWLIAPDPERKITGCIPQTNLQIRFLLLGLGLLRKDTINLAVQCCTDWPDRFFQLRNCSNSQGHLVLW